MIRYFILTILMTLGISKISAQQTVTLKGKIIDADIGNEPIMFANIRVIKNGEMLAAGTTDFDGYYNISNIPPDTYDIEISHIEYPILLIRGIVLNTPGVRAQNIQYNENYYPDKDMNNSLILDSLPESFNDISNDLIIKVSDIYYNN